ncbi:autotransporter-associated beta strand repeat-containing protein [Termitidicoccus mucosus]|uniref:autotransporter-associated beta strand repeat-containing protein n=1 Tax=Termitidicoccus mucosus TaxID=1184151 RepID=UPI003183FD98
MSAARLGLVFWLLWRAMSPLVAQTTATPVIIGDRTTTLALSGTADNYEILAGTLVQVASGNAISGNNASVSHWYLKNSGTVTTTGNSGLNFTQDASVTNLGLIESANTGATQAGVYFASTAAGDVTNSGTILGGLKGINFGNTARLNTVVNHAGALIQTSVNATNGGAIYSANNNTVAITNAGEINGALRGLHLGGASAVTNSGTITGGSGVAIWFNNTTASSTLTLDTGSVLNGDIVSNAGLLNHVVLTGSGVEDSHFIGASGDPAKGFASLTMDGTDWTLSGTVQLSGVAADTLKVAAGRLTLAGQTIFAAAAGSGITISAGGTLQIGDGGAIIWHADAGPPAIANDGAVVIASAGNYALSGDLSGSGVVVQAGAGVLALTGNNTHTGGVRVDSGTLFIDDDAKLGALAGSLALNGGAALYGADITTARAVVAGGILDTNSHAVTLTGAVSGTGALTKTGAGQLTLSNTGNNYTGDTTIVSGTLKGHVGTGLLTVQTGATYIVADGVTDAAIGAIAGNGTVDLNGANLAFNVISGTQTYAFAGALANGGASLRKTGAGTLDLGAGTALAAAFATGITVENGTLKLDNQNQIGAALILGSAVGHGLLEVDDGLAAWTKTLTLTGSGGGLSIAGGTQALTATVEGTGDFVKAGAGTLDITGATMNQTGGGTRILGGTLLGDTATIKGDLTFANDATAEFAQNTTGTLSGLITGAGHLIMNGTGELVLANSANAYTGDTTIKTGTLTGHVGQGTLTVESAGTYKVADGVTEFELAGIVGQGTVNLNAASLNFNVASGTASEFNFTGQLDGGPAAKFNKTGGGTLTLSSSVALGGGILVKDGVLRLSDESLAATTITLGDTTTAGLIAYDNPAAWTKSLTLTGSGGGFQVAASTTTTLASTAVISGSGDFVKAGAGTLDTRAATITADIAATRILDGTLLATAATLKGTLDLASATSAVEIGQTGSATLANAITGAGRLVKTGDGYLELTNAGNNYGDTTVRGGTLSGHIGVGALEVAAGATYIVAPTATSFELSAVSGSGTINLNNASLTMNVAAGATGTFAFTGALTGGDQFIKTGAGTLELQTAVALTNGAHIQDGTVTLADQSYLGAPVVLGTGTTFGFIDYTGAGEWTRALVLEGQGGGFAVRTGTLALAAAAAISGSGDLIKTGAGTLDLTAADASARTGGARVLGGTLRATAAALPGDAVVSENSILEFAQASDGAYAGSITGSGALVKTGPGTLMLSGSNSHTGGTEVREGTLAGTTGSLVGDIAVQSSATMRFEQDTDGSYDGVISGAGLIEKAGAGKVVLTGTYAGSRVMRVRDGALQGSTASLRGNIELAAATATVVFDQAADASYAGVISGAGGFEKTGAGTLTFATAQTYTGDTVLTQGTLKTGTSNVLNPASALKFTGAATFELGKTSQAVKSLSTTGGPGTIALTAAVNPAAELIVSTGRLTVADDASGDIRLLVTFEQSAVTTGTVRARLVDVQGANAASYTIDYANRAVLGAYDLKVNAAGWLLPENFSPEIPSAAALPALAGLMAKAGVDSLHQCLGEVAPVPAENAAFWLRGISREDSIHGELFDGLSVRTAGAQLGVMWPWGKHGSASSRLDAGIVATFVQARSDYKTVADIDAGAQEAGVFVTSRRGDWYADLLANVARNRYKVAMRDSSDTVRFEGWGTTVALEAGRAFATAGAGVFEPQARVMYQNTRLDETADAFKREYSFDDADSLHAQAGLRWHMSVPTWPDGAIIPSFRVAVGYEFLADSRITVMDVPFDNDLGGLDFTAGGSLMWWFNRDVGAYVNGAWTMGEVVNSTAITAGLRVNW